MRDSGDVRRALHGRSRYSAVVAVGGHPAADGAVGQVAAAAIRERIATDEARGVTGSEARDAVRHGRRRSRKPNRRDGSGGGVNSEVFAPGSGSSSTGGT